MIQGTMNTEVYPTLHETKKHASLHGKERCSYFGGMRGLLSIKWKLFTTAGVLIVLIFVFTGIIIYLNWQPPQCRKGLFNVHIVPYMHSYLDPHMSPDAYFDTDVRHTLDFVVNSLEKDPSRRYTITEMHFFWKWWKLQNATVKDTVKRLMNDGRLEMGGGGWVTPDEATVHYTDFIDQFSLGLRCLEEIYGDKVGADVSLMIDNRGHSSEVASMLRRMEVRGLILGGVSPHEQCYRRFYRKMEFFWSDSDPFGVPSDEPDIMTSILDDRALKLNIYFARDGPEIDLEEFLLGVMSHAFGYASSNVFIPVGQRFRFSDTENMFNVIDLIINMTRFGTNSVVNVMYSTPSSYLNSEGIDDKRWCQSSADLLPFAPSRFEYWTGYYSSRPSLRYQERMASLFLKVFKQMLSISGMIGELTEELNDLRETVALCQHHKAVAGIASQSLADYFSRLLDKTLSKTVDVSTLLLDKMTTGTKGKPTELHYESCLRLNISECAVTEKAGKFVVTVYNPSNRYLNKYVRVPVTRNRFKVVAGDGTTLPTQVVVIAEAIRSVPGRTSEARKELVFRALRIPALGFKSYYVSADDVDESASEDTDHNVNKAITLVMNATSGKISHMERNQERYAISQEILYYPTWLSSSSVFKPDNMPQLVSEDVVTSVLNDGEHVTEYQQVFGPWASQIVTTYKEEDFIEFKWIVGPIPVSSSEGKEVITSFQTDISNKDIFHVDSNGRGMMQKHKRAALENETMAEIVPGFYRPVTSHIAITDGETQLHVFNDRPQGGTTTSEGELQLMINRRLLSPSPSDKGDDLDEGPSVVTGRHWLFLGAISDSSLRRSIEEFAVRSHWEPWYFFADASSVTYDDWKASQVTEFSGLHKQLPRNLRILTLEPWTDNKILLRLENTGQDACDEVRLNLQELFSQFEIVAATEVSLAGNGFKESLPFQEHQFRALSKMKQQEPAKLGNSFIFLYPAAIKTFLLDVQQVR